PGCSGQCAGCCTSRDCKRRLTRLQRTELGRHRVPTCVGPNYPAVDWVLTNTVNYSPADGNLIMSIRNQDWVVKIDYRNGQGDGHVIWRLGKDGDFTVNSTDPSPWFSHQHDARYIDDSTIILFDNGNTRHAVDPAAHSRGQVWKLDEQNMMATLVLNADMGNYSDALGSAQRLSNGNFFFDSGRQGKPPWFAQSIEVLPDGTKTYVLQDAGPEFHSYRMRTLYEGINDQLADDDGTRRTGTSRAGSDPASINSGPDTGSAGLSADDMNAAAARASIASSRLATPPTLPASLPSVLSEALAPDSIDVLLLDGGKV